MFVVSFSGSESCAPASQQSVHWTLGIPRHFRAFSTPEQNLAFGVLSTPAPAPSNANRWALKDSNRSLMKKTKKFNVRFVILLGLLALTSCAKSSSRAPLMVSEVVNDSGLLNQQIRVSGAVVGESITVDKNTQQLAFLIADIPVDKELIEQEGGMKAVLENAVNDPNRQRLQIAYIGDKPELLANMVHAIILGELHSDGIFYADSIALVFSSSDE